MHGFKHRYWEQTERVEDNITALLCFVVVDFIWSSGWTVLCSYKFVKIVEVSITETSCEWRAACRNQTWLDASTKSSDKFSWNMSQGGLITIVNRRAWKWLRIDRRQWILIFLYFFRICLDGRWFTQSTFYLPFQPMSSLWDKYCNRRNFFEHYLFLSALCDPFVLLHPSNVLPFVLYSTFFIKIMF